MEVTTLGLRADLKLLLLNNLFLQIMISFLQVLSLRKRFFVGVSLDPVGLSLLVPQPSPHIYLPLLGGDAEECVLALGDKVA